MRKLKVLSFASLPLVIGLLAGCGHEHTFAEEWSSDENAHWHAATCEHKDQVKDAGPHVDDDHNGKCDVCDYQMPAPVSYEVTADEWVAAFGLEKPFYIADNYKLVATMSTEGQSQNAELIVDGLKLQANEKEDGVVNTTYDEISGDKKYEYEYNSETKKWSKIEVRETIADDFAQYLQPYGENYSSFAYNAESKSYKCSSITYKGQAFTNLEIKFENKQIKEAKFDSAQEGHPMSMVFAFTYGGQTVTLPEIEQPQPGAAVYGYNLNGSGYVAMIHEDKNNQWLALDISVSKDDTITFANMSGSLQEPAVLTTLYCEGETHGFAISEGVLTAGEDGTYSFIISPEETKDRITIEKQESPAPETNCKLMGYNGDWTDGLTMSPTFEGSTEFVAHNLDIEADQNFQVKFGDDVIKNYKNGGTNNALDEHLAEVDGDGNLRFNFGGVYSIYFESNIDGLYGVFVEKESVDCPYIGQADGIIPGTPTEVHEEQGFFFHKVDIDNNFIEYYLVNCPAFNGIVYTMRNGMDPVDYTLEEGGEGLNFEKVDSAITYTGSATALDFYLKKDLANGSLSVYVEEHLTMTYNLTINCESEQSTWAFGDDVDLFVLTISSSDQLTWIKVTPSDGSIKVSVPEDTVRFLVVRCVKGTETPDWNITSGDEVGRIYNQTTPDTPLVKGPGVYTVHFVDYPIHA